MAYEKWKIKLQRYTQNYMWNVRTKQEVMQDKDKFFLLTFYRCSFSSAEIEQHYKLHTATDVPESVMS